MTRTEALKINLESPDALTVKHEVSFYFSSISGPTLSSGFSLQNLMRWFCLIIRKEDTKSFYWIRGQRKPKGLSVLFFHLPSHIPSVFLVLISKPETFLNF